MRPMAPENFDSESSLSVLSRA